MAPSAQPVSSQTAVYSGGAPVGLPPRRIMARPGRQPRAQPGTGTRGRERQRRGEGEGEGGGGQSRAEPVYCCSLPRSGAGREPPLWERPGSSPHLESGARLPAPAPRPRCPPPTAPRPSAPRLASRPPAPGPRPPAPGPRPRAAHYLATLAAPPSPPRRPAPPAAQGLARAAAVRSSAPRSPDEPCPAAARAARLGDAPAPAAPAMGGPVDTAVLKEAGIIPEVVLEVRGALESVRFAAVGRRVALTRNVGGCAAGRRRGRTDLGGVPDGGRCEAWNGTDSQAGCGEVPVPASMVCRQGSEYKGVVPNKHAAVQQSGQLGSQLCIAGRMIKKSCHR